MNRILYKAATNPTTAIPNPALAILFAIAADDCVCAAAELVPEPLADDCALIALLLALAAALVAADEAELIADETDAAAEEADPVIVEVIDMLPLLPVLPPCGTGVAREVGVPVEAHVAEVGRLVTPCPAHRESANLIVTAVRC